MNAVVTPILQPDASAMQAHIEHLFGGFLDGCQDGLVELAWTDTRPDDAGRYRLKNARLFGTDQLDELVDEAARLNATPMCNVYIGAALRHPHTAPFGRAKDDDAWALTSLYVDLDDPGVATAAKEIYRDAKPTMVVVTGRAPHTRAQLWWRLSEVITDTGEWPAALRGIAAAMNGDPTVTNPSRVMRLAGSIAWPVKEGRTIEATAIQPLRNPGQQAYVAEHIKRLFPPVVATAGDATVAGVEVQHSTNSLGLSSKITDGRERYMRDTVLACLIEFIGENGTEPSAQELFDAAWPQYAQHVDLETRGGRGPDEFAEKCRYTLERFARGELRGLATLDDVLAVYVRKKQAREGASRIPAKPAQPASIMPVANAAEATKRYKFEKIGDLRDLPPTKWLVRNFVPEGATGILYGQWATGKSFIGFDLLLHLAYGMTDWHGEPLSGEPCHVLVIAREGHQGFVQRIDAFKKHHGIIDDTERVTFMRGSVSFMRDEEFAALCEGIKEQQENYRLVMIDTVARVLPGVDMNEQQTVTLFMERCSTLAEITGAAAVGVHHQNKSGSMMGSVYFEANADFVFEVERTSDDDSPLSEGVITCTKMKDGEDRWKRAVKYERVPLTLLDEGPSSLVVSSIAESKASAALKLPPRETCKRILNAVAEAWHQGQPMNHMPQARKGGRYAPRVISSQFDVSAGVVEILIQDWIDNAIVSLEMFNTVTKAKGLKVLQGLD